MAAEIPAQNEPTASGEDELLDHEYDGIREYDNPLPRWWVWIFWGSFYFALGYLAWYHVLGKGASVAQAYDTDMAEFREWLAMKDMGAEVTEEALAGLMTNPSVMTDAAELFKTKCVQCHADGGRGNIGPNLTDDHWIHGKGTLMDIYKTVHDGVAAKGMPAWGRQLRPVEIRKVVAYVGTIRNTNLPGKAPEGTRVEPASVTTAPGDSAAPVASAAPSAAPQPSASGSKEGD